MKQTIIISYIKLVFIMLFITYSEDAVAQQDDVQTRQCHIEIRKTMKLEGLKQLNPGDQKRVNENCKQGNIGSAIRYVMRIGAFKRCTYDLNTHIKKNNLVVAKDVQSRAYSQCRRGDLRKAIEVLDRELTKVPRVPAKIISFVASTTKVKKGNSVTLSWHTANANTVMLGKQGTTDFPNVQTSGSQLVSPDKDSTYVLMVGQSTKGKPTAMKTKTLHIAVSTKPKPPTRTRYCKVTGLVGSVINFEGYGDRHERYTIEKVYLRKRNSNAFVRETRLDKQIIHVNDHRTNERYLQRKYTFTRIPEYRHYIVTLGGGWITQPVNVRFSCPDNRGKYKFTIKPLKHIRSQFGG